MNTHDVVRLFVAIDLPDYAKMQLKMVQDQLHELNLFEGRYTEPFDLHSTLKFLGNVPADQIDTIDKKLRTIQFSAFQATIDKIGIFATENKPKIIYAHIFGEQLYELATRVEQALSKNGQNEQSYVSHCTLARIKKIYDVDYFYRSIDSLSIQLQFPIDSFVLKQSVQLITGTVHREIAKYGYQARR